MKVENMISAKGNKVANQFVITDKQYDEKEDSWITKETFQSYDSTIAIIFSSGVVLLDENTWDYSVTTGKYRNDFLGEGIAETRAKIKSGEYLLTDLNK
jgi:hypothetical protein